MAEEAKGECGVAEVAAVVEAGMDHLGGISIRAIKETVETGVAINGLKVEAMEIGETMVAMAATTPEVGTTILKEDGEIRAMAEAMVETDQATMAIWATATVDGEVPAEAMAEAMAAMEEGLLWMLEDMIKATVVDLCAKIQVVTVVEAEWGWVVTALLLMVPDPTVGEEEADSEAVEVTVVEEEEAVVTVMAIVRKHEYERSKPKKIKRNHHHRTVLLQFSFFSNIHLTHDLI